MGVIRERNWNNVKFSEINYYRKEKKKEKKKREKRETKKDILPK